MATLRENDLEEFCRRARTRLVGALSLYLGDAGVAEELANEALLRAVDRWPEVRAMASPEGWVHVVAFNLARSRFRRIAAERRAHDRLDRARTSVPDHDPAEAMEVRAALMRLPLRQREAIVCRYYLDLSAADTAAAMRCSPGTVKVHLRTALAALRDVGLGDDQEEP